MIVWDQTHPPPKVEGEVLAWQHSAEGVADSSIPHYVEANGERLRAKYLAFVHDLGEGEIGGRRLREHLDVGHGFSFWWMTRVAEKSPFKSPRIYDCLRLLALEEILRDRKPAHLTLHGSDRDLARALQRLCRHLGMAFVWRSHRRPRQPWSLRRLFHGLPYWTQGLISLLHLLPRWPLRKLKKPQWFSGEDAIFLCSYFTHLDPASCAQGRFYSRLWEVLPNVLQQDGWKANWMHHCLFSSEVPDAQAGLRLLDRFNQDPDRQGAHAFLDSYLSVEVVKRLFTRWIRLNVVAWRLGTVSSLFYPNGSSVWLWPVLRSDWGTSLTGPVAVSNCLSVALFDAALKDLPPQKRGLYLHENLGWEKAFLHAWRKHGHGKIIAVAHATIPFWSLNHFDDRRCLNPRSDCAMPQPDFLAVNGPMSWRALVTAGYPSQRLMEVEALRYLNLLHVASRPAMNPGRRDGREPPAPHSRVMRVLVLGDCLPASMQRFCALLQAAAKLLPSGYVFAFKPHPRYSIDLAQYPGLPITETTERLDQLWGEHDVVVAVSSTNAAVEAYVAGLPVIIGLEGTGPNVSPLRGLPGVRFVGTPAELIEALQTAVQGGTGTRDPHQFFFLDPALPRWRRLLSGVGPMESVTSLSAPLSRQAISRASV